MKLLSCIFKSMYLFLPPLAVFTQIHKYDVWMLLVIILVSYSGSLSRILKFHGLPLFYLLFWIYLQYNGFNTNGIYSYLGLWLFWGYGTTFLSEKCNQRSIHAVEPSM